MKTAVSIPDEVFEQAERLARQLKKSRSQLYAEALVEYTARYAPDAMVAAINEAYGQPDEETDAFVDEAARRALSEVEW